MNSPSHDSPQVEWSELPPDAFLLDVRSLPEYLLGHDERAVHIPSDHLKNKLQKIPRDCPVFVYCHAGIRSQAVAIWLRQQGIDARNIAGGYKAK